MNYEKNPRLILRDYDYHQASATLTHQLTERDQVNITLSSSRFKTPIGQLTTLNHIGQLGWRHSFSEQISAYISGGILYTQTESTAQIPAHLIFNPPNIQFVPSSEVTTKNNSFGQVFQATVSKSFERGSLSINASRSQVPTGIGNQQVSQLSINNSYALSERWNTGINASYSIYDAPALQNSSIKRTYYSIGPNINWKWTEEMSFRLSYTYRQQKFDNSSEAREGNTAQLQFIYQPLINNQVK
ncbi:MAG: BamA/TamA family outer membrane protein [Methylobacter sp.]|nr:BamA/TamA family outer membrane protein [Methylobacter sp.]